MFRDLFDLGDAFHIDPGPLSNAPARPSRDKTLTLERRTGLQLDLEPNFIFVFQFPDRFHPGAGVALNHLLLILIVRLSESYLVTRIS
jgi:hypothetical protein